MPFLLVKTNVPLDHTMSSAIMHQATIVISQATGKPKNYIMVNVCGGENLMFGDKLDPCAYLEMKSVGMTAEQIPLLSAGLAKMMEEKLHIPPNHVYIEFASVPGKMWGYNGSTF